MSDQWTDTSSTVVVVVRTFGRNCHALRCDCTPGEAGLDRQTRTTVVRCSTTAWGLNTSIDVVTPGVSRSGADTVTTVVEIVRTVDWDSDTLVGESTPGPSGRNGKTFSTRVISGTALRNEDTRVGLIAPGHTTWADTVTTTVEVGTVWIGVTTDLSSTAGNGTP